MTFWASGVHLSAAIIEAYRKSLYSLPASLPSTSPAPTSIARIKSSPWMGPGLARSSLMARFALASWVLIPPGAGLLKIFMGPRLDRLAGRLPSRGRELQRQTALDRFEQRFLLVALRGGPSRP